MNYSFARLPDSRLEEAFEILQLVSSCLLKQGIRQRIAKLRIETYRQWQSESTNWIVTDDGQIRSVVTLRQEPLDEWPEFEQLGSVWMLRALATHPDHFGSGIGGFAVRKAIGQCPNDSVYLDCVSDSLPNFYMQQGFEAIGKQIRTYPDESHPYNITLMRRLTIRDA